MIESHLPRPQTNSILPALLLLLSALGAVPASAQEAEPVGRVISVQGQVEARAANGSVRALSRRADIHVQDTIITGPDGYAQIRLIDQGMIAFRADTEFTFVAYASDGAGGNPDNALMELVRGGFRTISGTIGDDSDDQYEVRTQFASIGIRGTTHEAVIDGNSLFTGVYDGGTSVSNAFGSLDTGEGANFDFSRTQSGQPPVGLLAQPAVLGNIDLNPDGNGDDAPAPDDNAGTDESNNELLASNDTPPPGGNLDGRINPADNIREPQQLGSPRNNNPAPQPEPAPVLTSGQREQIETEGRLGLVLFSSHNPGEIFAGNTNNATDGGLNVLLSNDVTSPDIESPTPVFAASPPAGSEFFQDGIASYSFSENGLVYDVQWNAWGVQDGIEDGLSEGDIRLYPDSDSSDFTAIDPMGLWLSVLPSSPTALAQTSGTVIYNNPRMSLAGSSYAGDDFSNFFAHFDVDFLSGAVSNGSMGFCLGCSAQGSQNWRFDFEGVVSGSFLDAAPLAGSGQINDYSQLDIIGAIQGYFTGQNGEAFAGGFNLFHTPGEQMDLASTHVYGLFLLEQERRLGAAFGGNSAMEQLGTYFTGERGLIHRPGGEAGIQVLGSSDFYGRFGASGAPIVLFPDLDFRNVYLISDGDSNYSETGLMSLTDMSGTGYNLQMGYWDDPQAPALILPDNLNPGTQKALGNDGTGIVWINYTPATFQATTGRFNSFQCISCEGIPQFGRNQEGSNVERVEFDFTLDLDTGAVSNGNLYIGGANAEEISAGLFLFNGWDWRVTYEGQVNGSHVVMSNIDGDYTVESLGGELLESYALSGDASTIEGVFTGNPAAGDNIFAGTYYLQAETGEAMPHWVNGYFAGNGYLEDRLSSADFQSMKNNVMILTAVAGPGSETNAIVGMPGTGINGLTPPKAVPTFLYFTDIEESLLIGDELISGTVFPLDPFILAPPAEVLGDAAATPEIQTAANTPGLEGFNVGWGRWASGMNRYTDPADSSTTLHEEGVYYWLSAQTTSENLSALSGEYTYSNVAAFSGLDISTGAPITAFDMAIDLDFSSGSVTGGGLTATAGDHNWNVGFTEGNITGALVNINSFSSPGDSIVQGQLSGVLTGSAENPGFASQFNLQEVSIGDQHIIGTSLLNQRGQNLPAN